MKRLFACAAAVSLWLSAGALVRVGDQSGAAVAYAQGRVEVSGSRHAISPPLRSVPPRAPAAEAHIRQLLPIPHAVLPEQPDPVVQDSPLAPLAATTTGLSFAGVGSGDYGFAVDAAPPDTNGAVGATQYVQWVNEVFAVYDKATGTKVYPIAGFAAARAAERRDGPAAYDDERGVQAAWLAARLQLKGPGGRG